MTDRRSRAIEQCNAHALRRAARAATNMYDEKLEPTGLRITQFLSLIAIRELDGISVNALAEALDLDRTTMGKNLLPLERDGLIQIVRSPKDARAKLIQLTAKGRGKLEEAEPLWQAAQAELAARLPQELPQLRKALEKVAF